MNTKLDVATFMRAGEQNVETKNPGYYPSRIDQAHLYMSLVNEEFKELFDAVGRKDIIETADACADLIWVVEGLMYSLGIDPQTVWDEVARSNHSKTVDGKLIKRDDGKVLKPDTFKPPNIQKALGI
jgi:predicted HAD superfamily Cof-like phosphohydrolase